MKKSFNYSLIFAGITMCLIFTDCKKNKENPEQPFVQLYYFTDTRDSNIYKYVKIGNQYWMAENLRYKPDSGSFIVYDKDTSYLKEYGYLYDWNTACQVCPSGWHLPSRSEWEELIEYLGGEGIAGDKLKEAGTSHWASPNEGATNESGFSALPGGNCDFWYNNNNSMGHRAIFWSTEIQGTHIAIVLVLSNTVNGLSAIPLEDSGFSVRCLKD